MSGDGADEQDAVIVRKAERGWVVGRENVSDLTSAMVLADLFAADQADSGQADSGQADVSGPGLPAAVGESGAGAPSAPRALRDVPDAEANAAQANAARANAADGPASPSPVTSGSAPDERAEAERLAVTVTQLEHALASRVRVEQAIGVLTERHQLRPREAFDLLRSASRARGRRNTELAHDVVESAANPLLRLPDELARKAPEPRQRSRSARRGRHAILSADS